MTAFIIIVAVVVGVGLIVLWKNRNPEAAAAWKEEQAKAKARTDQRANTKAAHSAAVADRKERAVKSTGNAQVARGKKRVSAPISTVGDTSSGVLACPKCHGTNFKAKRSRGAKIAAVATIGVGTVLVPKHRVRCETCGTEYMRG